MRGGLHFGHLDRGIPLYGTIGNNPVNNTSGGTSETQQPHKNDVKLKLAVSIFCSLWLPCSHGYNSLTKRLSNYLATQIVPFVHVYSSLSECKLTWVGLRAYHRHCILPCLLHNHTHTHTHTHTHMHTHAHTHTNTHTHQEFLSPRV